MSSDKIGDAILRYIADYTIEHGWPPTVREIGAAFGWKSSSTTHHHLTQLVKEGRLYRGPNPRQLRVVI